MAEQKPKRCLLLTLTQTFPSVFFELLPALLLSNILLSISFSVSKQNLLEITESLRVPGVNSVSFKTEQISHLQTHLVVGLVFFLICEHFVQVWSLVFLGCLYI